MMYNSVVIIMKPILFWALPSLESKHIQVFLIHHVQLATVWVSICKKSSYFINIKINNRYNLLNDFYVPGALQYYFKSF